MDKQVIPGTLPELTPSDMTATPPRQQKSITINTTNTTNTTPPPLRPAPQYPSPSHLFNGLHSASPIPPPPLHSAAKRPAKRQKISLACKECRDRKTKCDGVRPMCGACLKKKRPGGPCVYEPDRGKRKNQEYVQLLENKVRELESAMHVDRNGQRMSFSAAPSINPSSQHIAASGTQSAPPVSVPSPSSASQSSPSFAPPTFDYSTPTPTPSATTTTVTTTTATATAAAAELGVAAATPSTVRLPPLQPAPHSPDEQLVAPNSPRSQPAPSEAPLTSAFAVPVPPDSPTADQRRNNIGRAPVSDVRTQQSTNASETDPAERRWTSTLAGSPLTHASSASSSQLQPPSEPHEGPVVDAMGAMTGEGASDLADRRDNRHGYFGSSSAMSFMREVREVIGKKTALPEDARGPSSLFTGASATSEPRRRLSQGSRSSRNTSGTVSADSSGHYRSCSGVFHDYVLPPRKVADGLVWSYWTFVHSLYPFLHKPAFMATYSRLWGYPEDPEPDDLSRDSEADPLFQCILNLVFALGCQLSPEIGETEREPAADIFFQRSKKLLHFDILEEGNLKVVQALLLMGQYLQCTKMPGRCWIVVGLAIRLAQGLGLHLDRIEKNQLERELHKRLWGGCIILDRVISMAYGRPFMIPVTRDLILPSSIDDELLTSAPQPPAVQPEEKPSQMAFFVHTLQLYEVMGDILTTVYSGGTRRSVGTTPGIDEQSRAGYLNSIIRLEIALNTWERSLPWFLRRHSMTSNTPPMGRRDSLRDNILLRQSNVLRARYLHTSILLYRPLFAYYFACEESNHTTNDVADTDLQKSLFIQSSTTCVKVAQELVDMIHHNLKRLLPSWWYNIFYLYTSATVLLMARLFPKIKLTIGENSVIESWTKCLSCLSEYQSYSQSAKWCYESLSELDKRAFQQNEEPNAGGMSSIQILGTLPSYTSNYVPSPDFNGLSNGMVHGEILSQQQQQQQQHIQNQSVVEGQAPPANEWDLDLQDMSWLGRLPVYTDLEPGLQGNQWLGRLYDGNALL